MPKYFRSDMAHIYVDVPSISGWDKTIPWDSAEGGDLTVESQTYSPGGMAPSIALGGRRTRSPMTVKRAWTDTMVDVYTKLDHAGGREAATVSYTPISRNTAKGVVTEDKTITYSGVLGPVTRPNYDSMSSAPAQLQIVIDLDESITS